MSYSSERPDLNKILNANAGSFDNIALELFHYQYANNELYRNFTNALHIDPASVSTIAQIPFLPISFFKTHRVGTGILTEPELIFESSGTTGANASKHLITDKNIYRESLLKGFEKFYGSAADYTLLALLPHYLERGNSSLVHMARTIMEQGGDTRSGFYLHEWNELQARIQGLEDEGRKTILLGVTYALLDFAEAYPMSLNSTIVMETGGMKGRREEWTRDQVHALLKERWQLAGVHSEYGMTELLSQAYAKADGIFECCDTMRVLIRDINDPLEVRHSGVGCINVVDLANINSCAFIATEDIGKLDTGGRFEVLGRMDHAALRGCSLMTA